MGSPQHERLARNESAFRELNESLGQHVHRPADRGDSLAGFVCECSNLDCDAVVSVDLLRYERVRSDARLFLVVPGHEIPDAEDVVDTGRGWTVVRKHDDVADTVAETDPRTP